MRPQWYSYFTAAIFVLLTINTGVLVHTGTFSEGLDAAAWLVLLALFELEACCYTPIDARLITTLRAVRVLAAGGVTAAAIGYLISKDWLDAANSGLWIGLVILFEIEVRRPALAAGRPALFARAALAIYIGLGAMVVMWLWRRAWFDAYDALLWLIAFVIIEMDVLRKSRASVRP